MHAETQFLAVCPAHVELPFTLGTETGQRQLDILRLRWRNYTGTHLRLIQSKTERKVAVPLLAKMRARLDGMKEGKIQTISSA